MTEQRRGYTGWFVAGALAASVAAGYVGFRSGYNEGLKEGREVENKTCLKILAENEDLIREGAYRSSMRMISEGVGDKDVETELIKSVANNMTDNILMGARIAASMVDLKNRETWKD